MIGFGSTREQDPVSVLASIDMSAARAAIEREKQALAELDQAIGAGEEQRSEAVGRLRQLQGQDAGMEAADALLRGNRVDANQAAEGAIRHEIEAIRSGLAQLAKQRNDQALKVRAAQDYPKAEVAEAFRPVVEELSARAEVLLTELSQIYADACCLLDLGCGSAGNVACLFRNNVFLSWAMDGMVPPEISISEKVAALLDAPAVREFCPRPRRSIRH